MLADCRSWTSDKYKSVSVVNATATHIVGGTLTAKTALYTGSNSGLYMPDFGEDMCSMIHEKEVMPIFSEGSWYGIV